MRTKKRSTRKVRPLTHFSTFKREGCGSPPKRNIKHQQFTAILGAHDFFGELCLAGYPLRVSTAVALTASSIRTIRKIRCSKCYAKKNNKVSNSLVAYLLSSVKSYGESRGATADFFCGKRLARVLLRLRTWIKKVRGLLRFHSKSPSSGGHGRDHAPASQLFMNRFRGRDLLLIDSRARGPDHVRRTW